MYAYISGIIKHIGTDYIVVEANSVGYKIITPNPYQYSLQQETICYTYLYVREDALDLYGFIDLNAKDLFEQLISVTGIGPKSACAILASGDVSSVIDAISRGDVTYLTKFPKVGPKTAQQIILDLKGKLKQSEVVSSNKELDEAIEALKALGYKDKEIIRVTKQLTNQNLTVQGYITKALQLMLK